MADIVCDVIVLTWNKKDIIESFVNSFLKNTSVLCRLIIIDNASNDNTQEYLATLKDTPLCTFKIIINKENKGFVGGMNQGIEISEAPYVCLANNDLLFTKGWLEEIISVFESNKNIGILNPNSNNLGTSPAERPKKENSNKFKEMPFCIGFCMVVKRELLKKIGGFSKEFHPFFFEDTDFSLRAQQAGFLIGVASASYVQHHEHASFDEMAKEKEAFFVKSRSAFEKKWGKILRIAWVEDNYESLSGDLTQAVQWARQANFVTFFTKNTDVNREDIFKSKGIFEHTGVGFKKFGSYFILAFYILIKKKKFNLVITKNNTLKFILRIFGQKTSCCYDEALIAGIKRFCGDGGMADTIV